MNPIVFALRRSLTVMMMVLALALGGIYSVVRMQKDIFPSLNQPVLYVIHNYGGMDPKQIEGLRLLSLKDTCAVLGCSMKTLRRRIVAEEIAVIRDGRLIRVHPDDLRRYIQQRRHG